MQDRLAEADQKIATQLAEKQVEIDAKAREVGSLREELD